MLHDLLQEAVRRHAAQSPPHGAHHAGHGLGIATVLCCLRTAMVLAGPAPTFLPLRHQLSSWCQVALPCRQAGQKAGVLVRFTQDDRGKR